MTVAPRIFVCAIWPLALAAPVWAAEQISVLSGGPGSAYTPFAVALGENIAKAMEGVRTSVQGTKSSLETLDLLEGGRGEVAFAPGDSLIAAWKGDEAAGFRSALRKLRGIAAIYPSYIQLIARADAGITTLADLKGKRISVGAPHSDTELKARTILGAAGLAYEDLAKVEYKPFGESVELIKGRQIDAMVQSVWLGASGVRDLAASTDVVVVPIPGEVLQRISNPAYRSATIPANTYRGQTSDVTTAVVQNYLVTREGVSSDIVYGMTKAFWSGLDHLIAATPAAKAIDRKHALDGMPVPLHPGAEKYYKEIGFIKQRAKRDGRKRVRT